jgi:hypothetical protein
MNIISMHAMKHLLHGAPKDKPRPPAAEGLPVAEWIGGEIRRVQQESRMAGGQILLRRLNRDEYANTVVDLLSLDVGMTDTIRNLLPADGTADGFDRSAAALYLDWTQMESCLDVAKLIADRAIFEKPLATSKLVWEPQKWIGFGGDKHVQADISKDIVLKAGARDGENRKDGIVAWNSGAGRPESDNDPEKFYESGYGPRPDLSRTVTTDGYYRIRFPAGASRGDRGTPIRLKLADAQGSHIAAEHTITEVQGTIDQPVMHEVLMFLRAPGPDQRVGLTWHWNAPRIIMTNPAHTEAWMGFMGAQNAVSKGVTDGVDEAALARLNEGRQAAFQALATFDQEVFQIIPGKSIEAAPKIFLGTFEIEGPIQEWPPKSHLALGLEESDAPNEQAIRRMFSEFIPRAFRRPVDAQEVDAIVSNILNAQREFGLSHHETLRHGLQALLVAPGFLMIQEPQQEKTARPLDNWEVTPILKPLEHRRDSFTIISGLRLTHSGGHGGDRTFLTGTNTRAGGAKLRVSRDQELAEAIGRETRFPSMVLGVRRGTGFGLTVDHRLSWTKFGTPLPAENRPDVIFDRLFRAETPGEIAARKQASSRRGSILDMVDAAESRSHQLRQDAGDRSHSGSRRHLR